MLSTIVIDAPFRVLLIDTTDDEEGLASRLLSALIKRGVALAADTSLVVTDAPELGAHANALLAASCVALLGSQRAPGRCLEAWNWISSNVSGPKLAIVCQWGEEGQKLTDAVLKGPVQWAPISVAQESFVSPREGALFLLKFLTEMDLHSDERITGRMAWFAWRKADELLKKRRMSAKFGLRA